MGNLLHNQVADVVNRTLLVPSACRKFSARIEDANARFGIGPHLLTKLLDLGLPHEGAGQDIRFDELDLENITLNLQLPSPSMSGKRLWGRSLKNMRELDARGCEVQLSWKCPGPRHDGPCDFSVSRQLIEQFDGRKFDTTGTQNMRLQVRLENECHDFGESFRPVLDAAASFVFHRIPSALRDDLGFLDETGLADCRLANRRLVHIAQESGMAARPACGFFVGVPYPGAHIWFEIEVDGRWVAADPFFLRVLHEWGVLDPVQWPVERSPRQVFWRIDSVFRFDMPLILHGDQHAEVGLMARRTAPGL